MPISVEQLARLIDRHAAPLRLWIGPRCQSADDVVQEAFCRLSVLEPPPEHPSAWLYRVTRNLAETERVSAQRRRMREQRCAAAEELAFDPAARLMEDEVVQAVAQLDGPLREVVVARIWGELTLEEIGLLCGVSTATASRRYRDALEELRRRFDDACLKVKP